MMRPVAMMVAALLLLLEAVPAVGAPAPAAVPFEEIPIRPQRQGRHLWAYASLAAGVGLVGASFAISRRADRSYGDYLASTDPTEIERLYDRTVRYDRASTASLLGGQALFAVGLYLRFLRPPPTARLSLDLGPDRCAATLRF